MYRNFVLKGDLCFSLDAHRLAAIEGGYVVCENGVCRGAFDVLPEAFKALPLVDCSGKLIMPGLIDLHMHAPQFSYRALGMDLELLDWLDAHTFPEESRFADLDYARRAYAAVVAELIKGPNTRSVLFATVHAPATGLLMDMLERSGLVSMVGKVNMDRNASDALREPDAETSLRSTRDWLDACDRKAYKNTRPILTPRFIPSCTDELMRGLAALQAQRGLPMQSHLSENRAEIEWVRQLCPNSRDYLDAYRSFGLLQGPTVMAHCVWSDDSEIALLRASGTFVAHCPQSNTNVSSGIAPVRRFIDAGLNVGLGSDVAGGCHTSIFRAMADAIQVSKLRWRLVDQSLAPLSVAEAFFLGTLGGGAFFGKVGTFADGFEFDALVIDDAPLASVRPLSIEDRLARAIYLSDDRHIAQKYVRGVRIDGGGR